MMKKFKGVIVVIMLMLMVTACGKADKGVDKDPVKSEESVKRVVSFSPSITELMYALDAGDLLVGRTQLCDYPTQVLEVESIGDFYTPDVEKIISLEPDVVIASALWTEDIEKKFTEAGIEVLVLKEINEVADVYQMITTLGDYLNREEKANQLIEEMKAELALIQDEVQGLDPVSVYYVVGFGEYGDYTATGDTYIHDMLTLAGGDNIAKAATGWVYSLETLLEQDPEIILIGDYGLEEFMSSPNYQGLSAVKNQRVYGIDTNLLDRQTNRCMEGIRSIASILFPEVEGLQ